jgi:hypothetical protein
VSGIVAQGSNKRNFDTHRKWWSERKKYSWTVSFPKIAMKCGNIDGYGVREKKIYWKIWTANVHQHLLPGS